MKREDFKQIIKLRSVWKINKRKGNYELPNGEHLRTYIEKLVCEQMKLDHLMVRENGDLCSYLGGDWKNGDFEDYILTPSFQDNEICDYDEMEKRIRRLALEII